MYVARSDRNKRSVALLKSASGQTNRDELGTERVMKPDTWEIYTTALYLLQGFVNHESKTNVVKWHCCFKKVVLKPSFFKCNLQDHLVSSWSVKESWARFLCGWMVFYTNKSPNCLWMNIEYSTQTRWFHVFLSSRVFFFGGGLRFSFWVSSINICPFCSFSRTNGGPWLFLIYELIWKICDWKG